MYKYKKQYDNFYISLIDRIFRGEIMYEYYKQIEECEIAIAKYVYGTDDISYEQAKALQRMYNTKDVIALYEKCNDWNIAIEIYNKDKLYM